MHSPVKSHEIEVLHLFLASFVEKTQIFQTTTYRIRIQQEKNL